jgi:hypothetical protein
MRDNSIKLLKITNEAHLTAAPMQRDERKLG